MRWLARIVLIPLFYIAILGWAWGDSLASKNKEGNKLYKAGKVDEALSKWRDAQIENPDNDKLHYNIGNGLHGQKKYEDAFNEYEKSIDSKNSELQSKAYYNMGNTHYRMDKLQEAIADYKKSLEINPDDEDAKYNIKFIEEKLKEQPKKENEQQEESQQDQDKEQKQSEGQKSQQKENNNQEQEEQDQSSESQQDQDKEQKQSEDKKSEEDKKERQNKNQARQTKEAEPRESSGEEKKDEMSKEDAIRLLDAMKDDEKSLQKELRNKPIEGEYKTDKDW
ncbi:MAG: tetratricopeptide repeat protein [Candidatus Omnitrophota bacterium]|nr:tetratricopeptide repeat protein [Candidatus Omnitrophota bacterium]